MGRATGTRWLPLVVEVEWYAGRRGFERPVAVTEGRVKLEVMVESVSSQGPADAGSPTWRVFIVRDSEGRRLRIRVDAEGRTMVEAEAG
jgi:hypothetical protein